MVSLAFPKFGYKQAYTHTFSCVPERVEEGLSSKSGLQHCEFHPTMSIPLPEESFVILSKCWTNPSGQLWDLG